MNDIRYIFRCAIETIVHGLTAFGIGIAATLVFVSLALMALDFTTWALGWWR